MGDVQVTKEDWEDCKSQEKLETMLMLTILGGARRRGKQGVL